MQRIRVASDRWNFQHEDGRYFVPLGGNMINEQHPFYSGTIFDRFDAAACDRWLGLMASVGLNCLRQAIGVDRVFDAATGAKAAGLAHWDTFLSLCEKHGIYVMPVGGYLGGNDWFDSPMLADSGKPLEDRCRFWESFAGHCADHPAILAYDLANELSYALPVASALPQAKDRPVDHALVAATDAKLKDTWPAWLASRYGSLDTMNRLHGTKHDAFASVPGSVYFVDKPFDQAAFDFRCYLNDRGYRWCKPQCDVIRSVAPQQMIASGNNGWLFPDMDLCLANGFHNIALHDLFDIVTIHVYPAPQCLPTGHGDPLSGEEAMRFFLAASVGMARIDHFGKPVMMQEFGWYGGGESRFLCPLPYRSEQEHADYIDRLCHKLIPHVNGFVNWPTFDMPAANDVSNHGGMFTHDGKPKPLAGVYERLSRELAGKPQRRAQGTTTLTYSLQGLYTSRQYQDRMWEETVATVHAGQTPDFRFV
ncbi:MAG: beta-galactosidase [Phycisphaerae bacterium]|nr:beta-galactosidase [Phycisphaerae bacterium]